MKIEKPAVKKLTIRLDLPDRRHHAGVLDAAGEIVAWEVIVNPLEVLTAFCARYKRRRTSPKFAPFPGFPAFHMQSLQAAEILPHAYVFRCDRTLDRSFEV
jgi:hypothetical protein